MAIDVFDPVPCPLRDQLGLYIPTMLTDPLATICTVCGRPYREHQVGGPYHPVERTPLWLWALDSQEPLMTTPNSRNAYLAYYEVLDRANDSANGIRVECKDRGEAHQYRVRLHTARQLDRALNREAREPGEPGYGQSEYDNLVVQIKEIKSVWWVYIKPSRLPNKIEELPPDGSQDEEGTERSDSKDVPRQRASAANRPPLRRISG